MNWQTGVALAVLVAFSGALIIRMIVNKRKGKSSCSCGCGGCAMKEMCHSKDEQK